MWTGKKYFLLPLPPPPNSVMVKRALRTSPTAAPEHSHRAHPDRHFWLVAWGPYQTTPNQEKMVLKRYLLFRGLSLADLSWTTPSFGQLKECSTSSLLIEAASHYLDDNFQVRSKRGRVCAHLWSLLPGVLLPRPLLEWSSLARLIGA